MQLHIVIGNVLYLNRMSPKLCLVSFSYCCCSNFFLNLQQVVLFCISTRARFLFLIILPPLLQFECTISEGYTIVVGVVSSLKIVRIIC